MLYFITSNAKKFEEMAAMLPTPITQLAVDLPEIQEVDSHAVIRAKVIAAKEHHSGEMIVEDTGLHLEGLNGLPGPMVKWFEKAIGNEGIAKLAEVLGNSKAYVRTVIGHAKENGDIAFYEGEVSGTIVAPRGENGFGWDAIFLPEGKEMTLAEMSKDEKNTMSSRKIAVDKLVAAFA